MDDFDCDACVVLQVEGVWNLVVAMQILLVYLVFHQVTSRDGILLIHLGSREF
jgi:hypothetical protein